MLLSCSVLNALHLSSPSVEGPYSTCCELSDCLQNLLNTPVSHQTRSTDDGLGPGVGLQ